MPSQKQVREKVKESYLTHHAALRKDCKTPNDFPNFQKQLQENIQKDLQKLYGHKDNEQATTADLVKLRMEKQMQKNLAAQETLTMRESIRFLPLIP